MKAKPKVRLTLDERVVVCDDDGVMTEASFVRSIVAQALPDIERSLGLMQTQRLSIGDLCTFIREQLDILWVLQRGQEGENRRKFDERLLANGFEEIQARLVRACEIADAQLARQARAVRQ